VLDKIADGITEFLEFRRTSDRDAVAISASEAAPTPSSTVTARIRPSGSGQFDLDDKPRSGSTAGGFQPVPGSLIPLTSLPAGGDIHHALA
jgi:hypothetical protein